MNHPNGNVAGRMPVNDGLSAGTMNVSERQNDILTAARTKGKMLPRHADANHVGRQDRLPDANHSNSTCRVEQPEFIWRLGNCVNTLE